MHCRRKGKPQTALKNVDDGTGSWARCCCPLGPARHSDTPLNRCRLSNTIGTLTDRTVTFATLVLGGMMDACPDLRICLAQGVYYTCYGAGRMDRGRKVRLEARINIQQPSSTYLNRFYYGCLTHSEPVLRYLIDTVGIDRLVIDTDCPANMIIE